ncbi:uncharacterized protein T551_00496 [Pneumocystis jirovecii RU7]|uniref:Uncharacterized protein n=1 Tax=Pneumocystis jirovecii (strain RU7) TaxID=1408657 RepID=A0A0W4ZVJ5_PNEJ7|nr:uncharacterized protein T551_00496 [Pneumocystis jirovecii RU7]KTW32406.1 hypothetical protein T551_00496 [Pneumocystis jirovecii RU7]
MVSRFQQENTYILKNNSDEDKFGKKQLDLHISRLEYYARRMMCLLISVFIVGFLQLCLPTCRYSFVPIF